jgi:hypothetical protein
MNSRRLTFLLVRTAVVFVLALVVAVHYGWSWFGVAAVALTAAALAIQFGGVLWLRRAESKAPE